MAGDSVFTNEDGGEEWLLDRGVLQGRVGW